MEHTKTLKVLEAGYARDATNQEILEAAAKIQKSKISAIHGVPEAVEYFFKKIKNKKREHFACVFTDGQNRPIAMKVMFRGTTSSCSVLPSEIVRKALSCDACGVVVAHNHPSGTTAASQQDKQLTKDLKLVLDCMDIRLMDHLIIGRNSNEYYSFRENGIV